MFKRIGLAALIATLLAGSGGIASQPVSAAGETAEVWISTSDPNTEPAVGLSTGARLTRIGDKSFQPATGSSDYTITVNEGTSYQQMDGFGVSLTDSSAWLLNYKLNAAKRAEVMEKLFGNTGIGLSVLRQPMGSSDFTWSAYTYDDTAGDTSLGQFTISRDLPYIVPMVKAAIAKNPGIKVFASPWSAPAWMKYSGTLNGGKLKAEYYQTYADYFKNTFRPIRPRGFPFMPSPYRTSLCMKPERTPRWA